MVHRYNSQGPTYEILSAQYRTWQGITQRLLEIASNVWLAVKDVLCADAPEGYELEIAGDQATVGTKDMLSFCWRALKESRLAESHVNAVAL